MEKNRDNFAGRRLFPALLFLITSLMVASSSAVAMEGKGGGRQAEEWEAVYDCYYPYEEAVVDGLPDLEGLFLGTIGHFQRETDDLNPIRGGPLSNQGSQQKKEIKGCKHSLKIKGPFRRVPSIKVGSGQTPTLGGPVKGKDLLKNKPNENTQEIESFESFVQTMLDIDKEEKSEKSSFPKAAAKVGSSQGLAKGRGGDMSHLIERDVKEQLSTVFEEEESQEESKSSNPDHKFCRHSQGGRNKFEDEGLEIMTPKRTRSWADQRPQ